MKKGILILICFCCYSGLCHGQNSKVDSLLQLLKTAKEDTAKVNTLNALADELQYSIPDTSILLSTQALKRAEKIKWQLGIGKSHRNLGSWYRCKGDYVLSLEHYSKALEICDQLEKSGIKPKSQILNLKSKTIGNMGNVYLEQGDYPKALDYYFKALGMAENLGDKKSQSINLGNIGIVYSDQSDYPKAIDYYFRALKMSEELGDKIGVETNLGNIGICYMEQGNYPKALDYYFKALKMAEELGDKTGIERNLGNIGNVYNEQGDYPKALAYKLKDLKLSEELGDKYAIEIALGNIGLDYDCQGDHPRALDYYLKALKMAEELGDKNGVARHLGNIGVLYRDQGDYTEALKNHFAALKIVEEIGDKGQIAKFFFNIGNDYIKLKKNSEAFRYLNNGLSLAKEIGSLIRIQDSYWGLSALDSLQANWKQSLENYKMYITYRDSLVNKETTKKTIQIQMQFEFDKKESLAKAEQEKKDVLALKELQKQKLLRNFSIGGIMLVLVLFFFIYRTYRVRQALRLYDIRNRIAGDLHDDIGSTLNSISIYSEVAKKKGEGYDEALEMIGDASRKVIEAMSDIVWTINAENDNFEKIIFRMTSLAYNLFHARKIEFTFHTDETLNEKKLSLEERRNFYLIFKEAVNNLVKYSHATQASISLTNENNQIRLLIQDNGVGFDPSQENAGNGLKNMKRRAEEMKAVFEIISQAGNGTRILLNLKA
jgi:two-component system sensor histidine kinase UhpB